MMDSDKGQTLLTKDAATVEEQELGSDYFRLRDFEYAQPLYDLAYILEADAIAREVEIPKYRTFSLWKAGYSFDGYSTNIDRWLQGELAEEALDYVPSNRIKTYLREIRDHGTIRELEEYCSPSHLRALRLRSLRGLGLNNCARAITEGDIPSDQWLAAASNSSGLSRAEILEVYNGRYGVWQSAHIVPPLARLLNAFISSRKVKVVFVDGLINDTRPIAEEFVVGVAGEISSELVDQVVGNQPSFIIQSRADDNAILGHQLGWHFALKKMPRRAFNFSDWVRRNDPFLNPSRTLKSDLHLHTSWSDGNASLSSVAQAAKEAGLSYFAVTDHSRSCKLQGGLTPVLWIRQAASIALNRPTLPILHGIEVDILEDGRLDLPEGLLAGMDIVVASVHSSWSDDENTNTSRLLKAIETGLVDILGHPTSAVVGKPGVPNFVRPPAKVNWHRVFEHCGRWRVALEFNCFPSRLDLPRALMSEALGAGCWMSVGSDAHSRSHLAHLKFGDAAVETLEKARVLNRLSLAELRDWLKTARRIRSELPKSRFGATQADLFATAPQKSERPKLKATLGPPQRIPSGSRVIGFDLTAGKGKATGVALLDGLSVETLSLQSDEELLNFVIQKRPAIVSIDSPLGFPGGGSEIDPASGIVRVAEHDLSSVGIPAYPALIDSMKELTLRGVRLRKRIQGLKDPPSVIESYPGAAQDVLCIPRKQKSLDLLREGLRELGIVGPGLLTQSHDEMDAITAAIVGRFYEVGEFLPMGVPAEAQLIVPRIKPLQFDVPPVIFLAGRTGAGKSVVARYLALFYGFRWVKTRDIIRELLVEDIATAECDRKYDQHLTIDDISDQHLRDFGLVILEKYKQEPLRERLQQAISEEVDPLVVDSVRDLVDINFPLARPVFVWLIESADVVRHSRLIEKSRIPHFTNRPTTHAIDQNVFAFHNRCDHKITNNSSLEDLRWAIDDTLFGMINTGKALE